MDKLLLRLLLSFLRILVFCLLLDLLLESIENSPYRFQGGRFFVDEIRKPFLNRGRITMS